MARAEDHSRLAHYPGRLIVGRVYVVHGALLGIFAFLAPLSAKQTTTYEWREAMQMLSMDAYIEPMRVAMPRVAELAWLIGLVGLLSLAGGLLAWWRRIAWPTDILHVVHIILLPLATWWGHVLTKDIGMASLTNTVAEVFFLLVSLATLGWGFWLNHRVIGSAASTGTMPAAAAETQGGSKTVAKQEAGQEAGQETEQDTGQGDRPRSKPQQDSSSPDYW